MAAVLVQLKWQNGCPEFERVIPYVARRLSTIARSMHHANDGGRNTWTMIIPGNFADGSATDLLFYDRAAGSGEFHRNGGEASLSQLSAFNNGRTNWSQVIADNFGGDSWTDLLFYGQPP